MSTRLKAKSGASLTQVQAKGHIRLVFFCWLFTIDFHYLFPICMINISLMLSRWSLQTTRFKQVSQGCDFIVCFFSFLNAYSRVGSCACVHACVLAHVPVFVHVAAQGGCGG